MGDRNTITVTIHYDQFADFLAAMDELNEIAARRRWSEGKIRVPPSPTPNRAAVEFEYADLGMKDGRRTPDAVVMRSGYRLDLSQACASPLVDRRSEGGPVDTEP